MCVSTNIFCTKINCFGINGERLVLYSLRNTDKNKTNIKSNETDPLSLSSFVTDIVNRFLKCFIQE